MPKVKVWAYRCNRCGHVWVPRGGADAKNKPKRCPGCKSQYWDSERQRPARREPPTA